MVLIRIFDPEFSPSGSQRRGRTLSSRTHRIWVTRKEGPDATPAPLLLSRRSGARCAPVELASPGRSTSRARERRTPPRLDLTLPPRGARPPVPPTFPDSPPVDSETPSSNEEST